jgi:hypothetical protein
MRCVIREAIDWNPSELDSSVHNIEEMLAHDESEVNCTFGQNWDEDQYPLQNWSDESCGPALGRFLRAAERRATHHSLDSARRAGSPEISLRKMLSVSIRPAWRAVLN